MPDWKLELGGAAMTVATLVGVPVWIGWQHARADRIADAGVPGETERPRVITLTAVSAHGIWTEDAVVGHNYWRRVPTEARPVVRVGERVVLVLKTADVTHGFAIPDLDIGPVPVEPGHPVEVRFTPTRPGEFLTQCSTRCGPCHEDMVGTLVVLGEGQTLADYANSIRPPRTRCPLLPAGGAQ